MEENASESTTSKSSGNSLGLMLGGLLIILLLGGGAWMLLSNNTKKAPVTTSTQTTTEMSASPTAQAMKESTPTGGTMMKGEVKTFTVTGKNFSFTPSQIKVKKGDTVKITFTNASGFHDFVIDEFKVTTKQLAAGASETVEFTADKAGTFEYYCSVGNHRAMGMKGNLIVE